MCGESLESNKLKTTSVIKFILLALLGLVLFVIPFPYGKNFSILVGVMADFTKRNIGKYLPLFMTIVISISALLSFVITLFKPKFFVENDFLKKNFLLKPLWLIFRIVGAVFAILTYFNLGTKIIFSRATGGTILLDLMPTLATWFLFSGILLPVLMESGVMDYIGTMIRKVMRPLFLLPGRSAIDALASWIGSGPVGVVITNHQYQEGFYTAKEASIISVCFSLVSLPFAVVVADFLKISHLFLQFYGTICLASVIVALILPRIYPLKQKKDEYHPKKGKQINEEVPEGKTVRQWALERGVGRCEQMSSFTTLSKNGIKTVLNVYMELMPLVMAWGTFALILTEYTPIFTWISYPFVLLLNVLQVPGAETAAPAVVMGFADMFLPAIIVSNLDFEITKFIVGVLSFTQLIYMTETGAIILNSEIPLNLKDLFVIFIERTLITLPIVVLIAHIIFK